MRTSAYSLNIGTDSEDANAVILLADGSLIAVLVQLSDESHGDDQGKWVIEATFGLRSGRVPDTFATAASAADWVSANICDRPFLLSEPLVQLS